ncbi:MAG: GGDEF domain-containing protein [Spirochaetes bacterium]|nr:GGDEF domain-containing protein [Spirochaetota bacterium]
MKKDSSNPEIKGEVQGSLLNGIVTAFRKINIISVREAKDIVNNIDSNLWYPLDHFFRLFRQLTKGRKEISPLLYKAGINFIEDWYFNGPGRNLIFKAVDYLKFQDKSSGYYSVVRGKPKDIGSIHIEKLDEKAGYAVIKAITPFPREYEMGVFYGGLMAPGDLEWVDVFSDEKPWKKHLFERSITIHFKYKSAEVIEQEINRALQSLDKKVSIELSAESIKALLWKYRSLHELYQREYRFWNLSNNILEKASERLYNLTTKLSELANTDTLTGLLNRRKILEIAELELRRLKRTKTPISFIMADIDFFKNVNDTYGHLCGDMVLQETAACIKNSLRETDYVARIGGEEFLIILPDTHPKFAVKVAEKLRNSIQAMTVNYDNKIIQITISLGVNSDLCEKTYEKLCEQADAALYYSKEQGRNKVTLFHKSLKLNHQV